MKTNVIMIPKNHEYIRKLRSNLLKIDVDVELLKPFHYSSPVNLAKILYYRMRNYKVVHIHWLYIFPFALVMKCFYYFCRGLGLKIVWEMHNILPHHFKESDRRNYRWFYEKVDAIIFHSEKDIGRAKELLGTDTGKTAITIPHGNFNESYKNRISKKEARKILGVAEGKKVILCFGFIRENRGYEYLIEAAKEMTDVEIIIAGKVDHQETYRQILKSEQETPNLKVFAKWIADDEIQVYLNACDIVVLPYTNITTSGVIPLAYAFSKPVITTDIGGIKDVVNSQTGILVPPRDVDSLRAAIRDLLRMDYEAMGRFAYEYSQKSFNWEPIAREIKKLYTTVLCA
ncbi:MAG TPA: glycosyltransferase family 4 protein [Thermodesulfobacteriota bacterium]|nr:glycosyltransferase family 4 protein [Thermodesulfobacteriota bacterium]